MTHIEAISLVEASKQALEFVERNTYGGDDVATLITTLLTAIDKLEAQLREKNAGETK